MTPQERKRALDEIWRHTHKDYKGHLNGERSILIYRNGTCLILLDDMTDAEIERDRPKKKK